MLCHRQHDEGDAVALLSFHEAMYDHSQRYRMLSL